MVPINLFPLLIVFLIITLVYSVKNIKYLVNAFLLILLSIPFNWAVFEYFKLYLKIGSTKVAAFEILFIALFVLSIVNILKSQKINIINRSFVSINIIWIGVIILFGFVGIFNNNLDYVINDIRNLCYYVFLLILININFNKNDLVKMLRTIITASIIFSIISILLFLFRTTVFYSILQSTQWEEAARLGFVNSFIIVIILPLAFIGEDLIGKKWTKLARISTILLIITVIQSQSMTLIVTFVFLLFSLLLIKLFSKKTFQYVKLLKTGISVLIIAPILYLLFNIFSKDNEVYIRLIDKINTILTDSSSLNSIQSRMITNNYNLVEIMENIWGYGLGKTFVTFIQNGEIAQLNAIYIDNTFYTVMMKLGIIGALIFIVYIVYCFKILLKHFTTLKAENKIFIISLAFSAFSLLSTFITTSQIFRNPIVYLLFQLIVFISIIYRNKCLKIRS